MSTVSDRLGEQAQQVKNDFRELGQAVGGAAQEKLEQAGEKAAECYQQGRDQVHGVACACEQYLSKRPLRSVLLAAGVGWLLGRFWKRG